MRLGKLLGGSWVVIGMFPLYEQSFIGMKVPPIIIPIKAC